MRLCKLLLCSITLVSALVGCGSSQLSEEEARLADVASQGDDEADDGGGKTFKNTSNGE